MLVKRPFAPLVPMSNAEQLGFIPLSTKHPSTISDVVMQYVVPLDITSSVFFLLTLRRYLAVVEMVRA